MITLSNKPASDLAAGDFLAWRDFVLMVDGVYRGTGCPWPAGVAWVEVKLGVAAFGAPTALLLAAGDVVEVTTPYPRCEWCKRRRAVIRAGAMFYCVRCAAE